MTLKRTKELNKILSKLIIDFELYDDYDSIDKDDKTFLFPFPYEEENVELDIQDAIDVLDNIDTIEFNDKNKVITSTITQRVVYGDNLDFLFHYGHIEDIETDDYRIRIVSTPVLIGLLAIKNRMYSKYNLPCSPYYAVEVQYASPDLRYTPEVEEELIKSYFFEIANTLDLGLQFTEIETNDFIDEDESLYSKSMASILEEYNEGMNLFIEATRQVAPDLKYISYYKILEYFAPIFSEIEAFKSMKLKLASGRVSSIDHSYIKSIFDLTNEYRHKLRDAELVKPLIGVAFDLVDIYYKLPLQIRKSLKSTEINYSIKDDKKENLINRIGNILYATRNMIVHAKSNFNSRGTECKFEDLPQLNLFMQSATYSTIKWYNTLTDDIKKKRS